VRADLSGLGDSPVRPGQRPDVPYASESTSDITALVTALDRGAGVVLVGLCSGARNALDAAVDAGARGVFLVNTPLHFDRQLLETMERGVAATEEFLETQAFRRWRYHVSTRLPGVLWRFLDRTGLVPSPLRPFERAVLAGVDVLAVYGAADDTYVRAGERGTWHLRALQRRRNFEVRLIDGLDHSAMARAGREQLLRTLTQALVARYGAASPATAVEPATVTPPAPVPASGTTPPG
jgi:hypothetical protein